jgi:hypothetical protein
MATWLTGRPSRSLGTAIGQNHVPPNLSGQYKRCRKVVKKKTAQKYKIFGCACPKYLFVGLAFPSDLKTHVENYAAPPAAVVAAKDDLFPLMAGLLYS